MEKRLTLGEYTPYQINPPLGVWRSLIAYIGSTSPDAGFWYSPDEKAMSVFGQTYGLLSHGRIAQASECPDTGYPDIVSHNVWIYENFHIMYRSQVKDTDVGYYVGWLALPDSVDPNGYEVALPDDFSTIPHSSYIDIYSSRRLDELFSWCKDNMTTAFNVTLKGKVYNRTIHSDMCDICCGIHRNCPLLPIMKPIDLVVPKSLKRSLSDDGSSSDVIAKQPRFTFDPRDGLLVREHLVRSVVDRVCRDHFILIESPPCSGKSTLLRHIAQYILQQFPHDILHLSTQWEGMKDHIIVGSKEVDYVPTECYNDNWQANGYEGRRKLINHIQSSHPGGDMWILIDEAQLTYVDIVFWSALYSVRNGKVPVYVIAAGSYGSHTGSSSHFPSQVITLSHRMNLFSDGVNPCFLAFTNIDAEKYMQQVIPTQAHLRPYKDTILESASPDIDRLPPSQKWEAGFHPGVVAGLTVLLSQKLQRSLTYSAQQLREDFQAQCSSNAQSGRPTGLGRAIPRPHKYSKFTPAAMMLFTAVMHGKPLTVPCLDHSAGAMVVCNYMADERNQGYRRLERSFCAEEIVPRQIVNLFPSLLRQDHPPILQTDLNSTPQNISLYIIPSNIALTPRERLLEVEHRSTSSKPLALRQRRAGNCPLSDFDQAAHDARRMGWLLSVPSPEGVGNNHLVLPTRWHGQYLQFLLTPKQVPEEVKSMTIDEFLNGVISRFRSSVLNTCRATHNGLHEKVVDAEFMHATEELAKDPRFLLPQVYTSDRSGVIDFTVPSKKWLLELLVEGSNLPEHIRRFEADQQYGKQWCDWEWRVINFRYDTRSRMNIKCEQLRTVNLSKAKDTDCMTAEIFSTLPTPHVYTLQA
ncbi:hypothetical protein GGU11DRAFT_793772 [Lentinula aff. detonsa]|nr:hypothetical protein GGU11DRAFT_793772 [Lentinula aff. detonsa]